jgi:hypothetical protein
MLSTPGLRGLHSKALGALLVYAVSAYSPTEKSDWGKKQTRAGHRKDGKSTIWVKAACSRQE